jgi:hypothetical protein
MESGRDKQTCRRKEKAEESAQRSSPDSAIDQSRFDGMTPIRVYDGDLILIEAVAAQLVDGCLGVRRVWECRCFKPRL